MGPLTTLFERRGERGPLAGSDPGLAQRQEDRQLQLQEGEKGDHFLFLVEGQGHSSKDRVGDNENIQYHQRQMPVDTWDYKHMINLPAALPQHCTTRSNHYH